MSETRQLNWRLNPISLTAGALVLAGGALSMLGWIAGIRRLTEWDASGITIKFNAAVCITAAGLALVLRSLSPSARISILLSRSFALFAAAIAGATLIEHITGINLGIDTLFFGEAPNAPATTAPGRMGPPAASTIILLGYALFLSTIADRRRTAAGIVIAAFCIPALSLTGYFFGAEMLYSLPQITGIAFQTALMLAVLAIGIALTIPEHGIVSIYLRADSGGLMFRRLLLPLILIGVVIGWLRLTGQNAGYYDTAFGTAARTMVEIIVFTALLWWTANSVSRAEGTTVRALEEANEGRLHKQIAATQEAERARLARDLHDHIGQNVTAMRIKLNALSAEAATSPVSSAELTRMAEQLEQLDGDISHLAWQIHLPTPEGQGLAGSLEQLGREWSAHHGVDFDFHLSSAEGRLPSDTENHLYRVVQEALNNIAKHARAKNVGLALNYVENEMVVAIEDDGVGFDAASAAGRPDGSRSGFGLVSMRERVNLMKGQLIIESQPGEGTAVLIRVPAP
jgi:signal transduction histidine kinase